MAKLNIYGQEYKIVFSPHLNDGSSDLRGQFDKDKHTIFLLSGQEPTEMLETILHEVGHAILHETGVSPTLHEAQEEILVDNLSNYYARHLEALVKLIPGGGAAPKKKRVR